MFKMEPVEGMDKGEILFFALSTCAWCAKTKKFLDKLGVKYNYVYMDLLTEEDSEPGKEAMRKWNPLESFPTVVINGTVILGYDRNGILEAIG